MFEQFPEIGMLLIADEEEEMVKTVLPVEAAKEEVVVEPEGGTALRFSECLILR